MPRFRVRISQWVEEKAIIIVKAASEEAARAHVEKMSEEGDIDWEDGDDVQDRGITWVENLDA